MRTPPLLADFSHARPCKPFCENSLTLPRDRDSYWMLPGYLEGLELAGLLPITLPLTEDAQDISQLVSLCDGFLFTGRQDVPTRLYSEKPWQACGEICEKRGTFEQRLFA